MARSCMFSIFKTPFTGPFHLCPVQDETQTLPQRLHVDRLLADFRARHPAEHARLFREGNRGSSIMSGWGGGSGSLTVSP